MCRLRVPAADPGSSLGAWRLPGGAPRRRSGAESPAEVVARILQWETPQPGGPQTIHELIQAEALDLASDTERREDEVVAQIVDFFHPYLPGDPETCAVQLAPSETFLGEGEVGQAQFTAEFHRPGAVAFALKATDPENDEGSFTSDVMVLDADEAGMISILFAAPSPEV